MTNAQLTALLEVLPQPACVCDGTGAIVARNRAARDLEWTSSDIAAAGVEACDLGDGWRLQRKVSPTDATPQSAATPQPAVGTTPTANYPADVDTLARGIVHEIRNPLAAILTAAKLVQDDPQVAEETALLLGVIRKESLHINDILSAFSNYVKPRPPRLDVFDLAQVVRETVAELRQENMLGAAVTVQDTLKSPLNVWADEAHFRSALAHILQNAADAVPYDTALHLSSQRQGGKIILCVTDNGPGFSPESLRRAFQPFYSTKPQSIGLGLSLAQATVQASGGRVWVENLSSLPAATSDTATPHGESSGEPSHNGDFPHLHGARACIELPSAPVKA